LQCVAVCCSVLQTVIRPFRCIYAVNLCCSGLQCGTVCRKGCFLMLHCVAVNGSVLQCVAGCCSVLQYVATFCSVLQCAATLYSVLQFFVFPAATTAVCRSVLQCYAVCCSSLSVLLQLGAKSAHTHATNESCHTYKHHTTRINQSWHTCSRSSCGVLVGKNFDCVCATVRSYGVLKDKNTYTIEILAGF